MDGSYSQLKSQKSWVASSTARDSEILLAGDSEEVLERLHRRYYSSFLHFFARRGCPRDACEDLTQEIFLRLCRSLATFDGRSKVETWLYTIANNVWRNRVRDDSAGKRDGQELAVDAELEDGGIVLKSKGRGPMDELLAKEGIDRMRGALEELPPRMRRCAQLRFIQGLKFREIAALEQVKIDTVKSQLGQAKERLELALKENATEAGLGPSYEVPK